MNIGERIAYFRKERKYSVNGLAMRSGVSQSYVRELELGHYENPTIEVLESLWPTLFHKSTPYWRCRARHPYQKFYP